MNSFTIFAVISFILFLPLSEGFVPSNRFPHSVCAFSFSSSATLLHATTETNLLTLNLSKPLGIILEEVREGATEGVYVKEVSKGGSAYSYADQIRGCTLASVEGNDVTALSFENVMDQIVNAPETVELQFLVKTATEKYKIGTPVTIQVLNDNGPTLTIQARVGDNLRTTLLDNGFEVYQGMKQKLGNCGGAGQCTFCVMDFIESEPDGWLERSDYEDQKLAKFPKARLACLNNIQGPATIQKTKR